MHSRSVPGPAWPLYDPYVGLYTPEEMTAIGRFLRQELDRSMQVLRMPGHPRVYFLSYLFRNERRETLRARLGAVAVHAVESRSHVYCDVRVGSYRYDQIAHGGLDDNSDRDESLRYIEMPSEVSEDA